MSDAKCTANEAVLRAKDVVARIGYDPGWRGMYWLGCGDYHAVGPDMPWTLAPNHQPASDCRFAVLYCWKLKGHRSGFNHGHGTEDWINYNSVIEDAQHTQELFTLASDVKPGDLLCYPTLHIHGADGEMHTFIGHGAIVIDVPADYKPGEGYHRLTIVQCHGPNGFKPGIVQTDGSVFDHHNSIWPKPQHRTVVVRPKERA